MSSIDPNASSINPIPRISANETGATSASAPLTVDVSTFSSSSSVINIPLPTSQTPTLTLAEFYQAVNDAALGQKLQEYTDAFNDAKNLSKMWQDAVDQAAALRDYINQIYAYVFLQKDLLEKYDIPGEQTALNEAIADYNNGVHADQAQVQLLNNAITEFNLAKNSYLTNLQAYNTAVGNQQQALDTYNSALNTWNAALESFQNGTIDAATLETYRSQFASAQATFSSANSAFLNIKSAFENSSAEYQAAANNLNTVTSNYNAYRQTRQTAVNNVNTAIDTWNATAILANVKIEQLNAIRMSLNPPLPPLQLMPMITGVNPLQPYEIPAGVPDPLVAQLNQSISNYNNSAAGASASVEAINGHVTVINNNGYTPPIAYTQGVSGVDSVPGLNVPSADLPTLEIPNFAPTLDYSPPEPIDVVTIYLEPRLAILNSLKSSIEDANRFQALMENLNRKVPDTNFANIGASTAGSAGSTIPTQALSSPFVDAILSKQNFEAFFNIYGAPISSPLVDQLGASSARLLSLMGLSSAGPANTIVGQGTFGTVGSETALSAAVALGFLKQISNVSSSDFLPQSILGFLNGDPSLNTLSAAQKEELANLLAGSINASMLEIGLNEVARSFNLPGLVPQVLANVNGLTTQEAAASLGGQLYAETLLAKNIAEKSTLQHDEAMQVSQGILQEIFTGQNKVIANAQDLQSQIVNAVLNQLNQAQSDSNARAKANEIADAVIEQIIADRMQQQDIQKDAYRQALIRGLQRVQNLDEREAARIATRIVGNNDAIASLNQSAIGVLPKIGLTENEIATVTNAATEAFNSKDPLLNPLSAPSLQKIVSSADLSTLFKTEVVGVLSPVIGNKKALQVAEDYGSLIFTAPNSVVNQLEAIERQERKSVNSFNNRQFDKYLDLTEMYRNPGNFLEKLTSPAKVLLSTGAVGGPSMQGTTSMDNNTGKTGHYKRPTDIAV
ncbi:hypothetical protein PHSC3_001115 [Chlamydiales bacterium STE3]|nr:hypothetical protein PHSC3_001115 [Chlamydiales bacterium STE3]